MNKKTLSLKKSVFFGLLVCMAFFSLLELSGRIALSIRHQSARYLLYGFISKGRVQHIKNVDEPYVAYYKSLPSRSRTNPVNRMGFRGPEIGPKKPGTVRILCLGASTTYGDNLAYRETYPALLQERLQQVFGAGRYEVINAGQPGFDLNHIIALTKYEGLALRPDIVVLLSANNNFKAPGFWFVQVRQEGQEPPPQEIASRSGNTFSVRLKRIIVRYSAIGRLWEDFLLRGWLHYRSAFDWEAFAQALLAEDNIWEAEYRENLDAFVKLVTGHTPATRIIVLEQAVNTIQLPALAGPWKKARQIMRETAARYPGVSTVDIHTPVINAAQQGVSVWQDKDLRDPLHLSRAGNDIIAETIIAALKEMAVVR